MCVAKDFMWLKEKEKSTVCSNETMKGPVKGKDCCSEIEFQ